MNKIEIEKILGNDFVVESIVEDEKDLYAFFVSKQYWESGGNDRYALLGVGPFYYDKIAKSYRTLDIGEYVGAHFQKELMKNYRATHKKIALEEVYEAIRKRRHINSDELELIMDEFGIRVFEVEILAEGLSLFISSKIKANINIFEKVFQATKMDYVKNSDYKITLDNP